MSEKTKPQVTAAVNAMVVAAVFYLIGFAATKQK